jgi:hypothetical protein
MKGNKMANDAIIKEIETKYKNVNSVDLADIIDYFSTLNPNKAKREWDFVRNNLLDDFPSIAKIRKFISDNIGTHEHIIDLSNAAQKCNVCGMIYANKRDRIKGVIHCPRCGQNDMQIIIDVEDSAITFCQDKCFMCPYFEENGRGVYGPLCPSHGYHNTEPECGNCRCAGCCKKFSMKIEIPKETQEERKISQEKHDWRPKKEIEIELSKKAEDYADHFLGKNKEK